MSIKHPDQRVVALIDVQNIYYSAKNLFHKKVNFGAILKEAIGERKLIRAIAYVIKTEEGEEETFFEALGKLGIETKVKDLLVYSGGFKKADWDVGITIDAIRLSSMVDTIILISGDGDFIPLLEFLKNQGKQVEVLAFKKSTSSRLIQAADDFIDLGRRPNVFLLKKRA
ncbi:MAG: NYN domain-containing protein [Candidatus Pacebacteria bacterium]|nr:NYN domain-containing protein [Candidatus Paceibacterota bacterium]